MYAFRIMKRTGTMHESDDILQESEIGLWEASRSYDESKGSFTNWAWVQIRKRIYAYIKYKDGRKVYQKNKQRYKPIIISIDEMSTKIDMDKLTFGIPNDTMDIHDTTIIREAIEKLNPQLKEIVKLKYYDGLSFDEIAKQKNCSGQWIRALHQQAIKKLRRKMRINAKCQPTSTDVTNANLSKKSHTISMM